MGDNVSKNIDKNIGENIGENISDNMSTNICDYVEIKDVNSNLPTDKVNNNELDKNIKPYENNTLHNITDELKIKENNEKQEANIDIQNNSHNYKNNSHNINNNPVIVFTFLIIAVINSSLNLIINMLSYPIDNFHNYNRLLFNSYLFSDFYVTIIYIYKKINKINNNKINYIIIFYSNIMIGYCLYFNINNFNSLDKIDTIIFTFLFFRYFIYVLQII